MTCLDGLIHHLLLNYDLELKLNITASSVYACFHRAFFPYNSLFQTPLSAALTESNTQKWVHHANKNNNNQTIQHSLVVVCVDVCVLLLYRSRDTRSYGCGSHARSTTLRVEGNSRTADSLKPFAEECPELGGRKLQERTPPQSPTTSFRFVVVVVGVQLRVKESCRESFNLFKRLHFRAMALSLSC